MRLVLYETAQRVLADVMMVLNVCDGLVTHLLRELLPRYRVTLLFGHVHEGDDTARAQALYGCNTSHVEVRHAFARNSKL
jgi:hypothetical protein